MRIRHRLTITQAKDPEIYALISQYHISFKRTPLFKPEQDLITFVVSEDDKVWEEIERLMKENDMVSIIKNEFSKEEILQAAWCRIRLVNHVGYPQPEDEWLSTMFTYADFDRESGFFSHQVEDFRIKQEPQLTNKHFMDLTWPHEVFAKKEVIEKLQAAGIMGWTPRNVFIHDTGEPFKEILQIVVPKITDANAILRSHPISVSTERSIKYMPHVRGMLSFTLELLSEPVDFVLSKEWFGDRIAFHEILVSQRVTKLIIENKWNGIALEPVDIVS